MTAQAKKGKLAQMRLKTFGELKLEGTKLTRQKPLLLLAYLAIEKRKPRRFLADLFYGDKSNPLNSLSAALTIIRKDTSPDCICADVTNLNVNLPSDVDEFLNALGRQDYKTAAELYQGSFLADLHLKILPELEEWLEAIKSYLAGRAREAFLKLAELELEHSPALASSYAEKAYLIGKELGLSFDEAESGLEADQYQRMHRLLSLSNNPRAAELRLEAESFGIVIKPLSLEEKKELNSQVLSIPHNLPLAKTSFAGRDQDLIEIASQLANPDCRLLTLHGMGGIGKSRLALQVAKERLNQGQFRDGIYFVALDALNAPDLIPGSIAEALGLELSGQDDTLTQLKRFIKDKQMLLILDNYEHLMEEATLPADLIEACPRLKLIVTSREILNLVEEWTKTLDGLSYPKDNSVGLEDALRYEAVSLFLQRAKKTRLEFSLLEEDLAHVIKVCELVEGSPLALELAATWVRVMGVREIASEIQKNMVILESSIRNITERHRGIHAVFESSWNLLSESEKEYLVSLTVFSHDFCSRAAQAVTDVTVSNLAALVNKSFLYFGFNGRYSKHSLIQAFIQTKYLENLRLVAILEMKYQAYYYDFLKDIYGDTNRFSDVSKELSNIFNAIFYAQKNHQPEYIIEIARFLTVGPSFFSYRGHNTQSLHLLKTAIEICQNSNDLESAHYFQSRLGDIYREQFHHSDKALEAYNKALIFAKQIENKAREAITLGIIAVINCETSLEKALAQIGCAYELAKTSTDWEALSIVLQHYSYIVFFTDDWSKMKTLCLEAIAAAQNLKAANPEKNITEKLFFAFLNLGEAELKLKNIEVAKVNYFKALKLAEDNDNQIFIAYANHELCEFYNKTQNYGLVKKHFKRAEELYRENNMIGELNKLYQDFQGLFAESKQ